MYHRLSLCALLAILLVACAKDNIILTDVTGTESETITTTDTISVVFSESGDAVVNGASSSQVVTIAGNGVTIVNKERTAITYLLGGSTSNGFLKIYSPKKQQIELHDVSIANPNGAAINVQGITDSVSKGKAVYLVLCGTNALADGTNYSGTPEGEDEKAALFSEGQIIVSGTGSLTVTAQGKSGIVSDDYVNITGGTITVNSTAGTFVSGSDTTKVAGIKGKDSFIMTDGTLTINCSGTGAKGISGDGTAVFNGGTVNITVTGNNFGSTTGGGWPGGHGGNQGSDNSVAAKGIKFDGNITFNGGNVTVKSTKHEAIESKGDLTVNGGHIYAYSAADDAINSGGTLSVNDGYLCAHATSNDGIDANGDLYIKGGVIYAIGASNPEMALDANTEGGAKLYIQGGTLIAIGSLENGASLSQTCYQASSWSKSTWYALSTGGHTYAFKTPSSGGTKLVLSGATTPTLLSGVTTSGGSEYFQSTLLVDPTVSGGNNVQLSTYTSGGGGWH